MRAGWIRLFTAAGRTGAHGLLVAAVLLAFACNRPANISAPTGDRVLLIGVDAATWDVIRPLIAQERLPTFARLVREGWSGTLRSMEPTVSPAIWTTIATGKTPAQHGITGFIMKAADGAEVPVTRNLRHAETLWTIASRYARTVNVVGWYVTWPVEPVRGVMVSDRFAPGDWNPFDKGLERISAEHPGVYPPELAPELQSLFVHADDFLVPKEREFHKMFNIYPVDATRVAIAERLMAERPADLTMVYIWGVDPIQHNFWSAYQPETWPGPPLNPLILLQKERIPQYYEEVDHFLARLLARAGPRVTVMIVSDHGAGPVTTYDPKKPVSGAHRIDGIIIAAGNHVRPGAPTGEPPSVVDVAPTVLYLLGLPRGEDMAGHVLEGLVDPAWLHSHRPRTIRTYETGKRPADAVPIASPADETIKQRLRSLGYIQ